MSRGPLWESCPLRWACPKSRQRWRQARAVAATPREWNRGLTTRTIEVVAIEGAEHWVWSRCAAEMLHYAGLARRILTDQQVDQVHV